MNSFNEFCNDSAWNIISGNWKYNDTNCSLIESSGDREAVSTILFGFADKRTSNTRYCHPFFILQATLSVRSGNSAGIYFRSANIVINNERPTFYLRLDPSVPRIVLERMKYLEISNGNNSWDVLYEVYRTLNYSTVYIVTIVARFDRFDVYLDGEMVFDNVDMVNVANYEDCTIGVRTEGTPTTFLSLTYNGWDYPTSEPTQIPITIPTSADPTLAIIRTEEPSYAQLQEPTTNPSTAPTSHGIVSHDHMFFLTINQIDF